MLAGRVDVVKHPHAARAQRLPSNCDAVVLVAFELQRVLALGPDVVDQDPALEEAERLR
jgi:hypothetical protein